MKKREEFIEVQGLPARLLIDTPPFRCTNCSRGGWSSSDEYKPCRMTQPDGTECRGVFVFQKVPR